jgi:hypothetical protein
MGKRWHHADGLTGHARIDLGTKIEDLKSQVLLRVSVPPW